MAINITEVKWEAYGLPDGLVIDEDTGVISGTPLGEPGTYTPTIVVTTNYGSDTQTITIEIETPENWMPIITPGQTIVVTADAEMAAYEVKGTNVRTTA